MTSQPFIRRVLAGTPPVEFTGFIASETAKWGKVIRGAKITAD